MSWPPQHSPAIPLWPPWSLVPPHSQYDSKLIYYVPCIAHSINSFSSFHHCCLSASFPLLKLTFVQIPPQKLLLTLISRSELVLMWLLILFLWSFLYSTLYHPKSSSCLPYLILRDSDYKMPVKKTSVESYCLGWTRWKANSALW